MTQKAGGIRTACLLRVAQLLYPHEVSHDENLPSRRFLHAMCEQHVREVVSTGMWPENYMPGPTGQRCRNCWTAGFRLGNCYLDLGPRASSDEHLAVHEAGHAVTAWCSGWFPTELSMSGHPSSKDGLAYCVSVREKGSGPEEAHTWGGWAASVRWLETNGYTERADLIDVTAMSRGDAEAIRRAAGGDRQAIKRHREAAVHAVERSWPQVLALADALVRQRRLSGGEIVELLEDFTIMAAGSHLL